MRSGVAVESAGFAGWRGAGSWARHLYSQTKNNEDEHGTPRIMIRENADDYLHEMASPENRHRELLQAGRKAGCKPGVLSTGYDATRSIRGIKIRKVAAASN